MGFEWDEKKSQKTHEERGVTFGQATSLWADPDSLEVEANVQGESRSLKIGKLSDGKIYTAVFTMRAPNIRIISFRRSRPNEEAKYEQSKD